MPQRRACYDLETMAGECVKVNVQAIQERISGAAKRSGRRCEEIILIGISKMQPAEAIREAYSAGVRHFGENRVQEWEGKRKSVADLAANWHMVGHLQSNKATRAARLFCSVDCVDSTALAQRLDRARSEMGAGGKLRVLIEVMLAPEETKSGVASGDLPHLAEEICGLQHVELAGLMCVPPYAENPEDARPFFRRLRGLKKDLERRLGRGLPVLSMGMSHDYEVAIEEGATEVRIGTAMFGARKGG
jgi:PLP dependent protein